MNHSHTVSAQQFCCQMRVFRISFGVVLVVLLDVAHWLGNDDDWNDQTVVVPSLASFDLCWRLVSMSRFLCLLLILLPVVLPLTVR